MSKLFHNNIDIPYLMDIAEKKFLLGHKTAELLERALSEQQRFMVVLVALMEVEESLRFVGMSRSEIGFVQRYHSLVRELLGLMRCEQRAAGALANQAAANTALIPNSLNNIGFFLP